MYGTQSIVLRSNFRNKDFDGFAHFEESDPPESEKFLAVDLFLSLCVCSASKTNNNENFKFGVLRFYHMQIL